MVSVPAATPDTIPEAAPTVAMVMSLLLHVPPPGVDARVEVNPVQTLVVPVIAVGLGLTVT
jgi:hypothetical protein